MSSKQFARGTETKIADCASLVTDEDNFSFTIKSR